MIDPCEWDSSLQSVTVTAGQSLSGIVIVVKTASVVKLRIQDSAGLLSLKTKDGRDPQILAGVWTGGGTVPLPDGKAMALPSGTFHPARLVGKDSGGANYEVAIPNDTPLRLHVMSPDLKLADAKGAAVSNNGAQVAFQHKSGDATIPAFSFTVTGAAR